MVDKCEVCKKEINYIYYTVKKINTNNYEMFRDVYSKLFHISCFNKNFIFRIEDNIHKGDNCLICNKPIHGQHINYYCIVKIKRVNDFYHEKCFEKYWMFPLNQFDKEQKTSKG